MGEANPRVLLVSQRRLRPTVCRTSQNEYEDTIVQMDNVHLVAPPPIPRKFGEQGTLSGRIVGKLGMHIQHIPRPQTVPLNDNYDLLFVVIQHPTDLLILDGCPGWREKCRTAIVYLEELYPVELQYEKMLLPLKQFDYVVTNCYVTAQLMREKLGINAVFGALATDAIRFCPLPKNPQRVIDFLSVGRRSQMTHQALLDMARQRDFYYVYDTFSPKAVSSPSEHREMFATRAIRSRYFLANKPQVDNPSKTAGHEDVGMRYYEAIATGAVMVGEPPLKAAKWAEHFPYEDACIRLPWDSTDVMPFLDALDAQPERLERIRHANVMNSLTNHDWAHRWRDILELADLPKLPGLERRMDHLKELAGFVNHTLGPRRRSLVA
jgi:hypothetical protein